MKYEVKFTTAYKKSYKLMKKRGLDLNELDKVVDTGSHSDIFKM